MSDRKKMQVEVSERRVTISDPDALVEATAGWYRSMAILLELQDEFEKQQQSNVIPCNYDITKV